MKWIAQAALALAFLTAGYGLGRMDASDEMDEGRAQPSDARPSDTLGSRDNAEFVAALRSALSEPMLLERTLRSAELLTQLSVSNVEDAATVYRQELAPQPIDDLLFSAWARLDGQAAFDYLQRVGEFASQQSLPGLMEAWATLDPDAALRAYESVRREDAPKLGPASRRDDGAVRGLVLGWTRSGDPGVVEFLSKQNEGSKLSKLLTFYIDHRLAQEGMDEVQDWADEAQTNDDLETSFKHLVLDRTGASLARVDGPRAAAWASQYAETPSALRVLTGVSTVWVSEGGPATMEWLASLPANEAREETVNRTYKLWLRRKPEDAGEWAEAAEVRPVWEPAIGIYAESLAESDPRAAVATAQRIDDPLVRSDSLIRIGQIWYRADPGPATAWLEESELDEEQRKKVAASGAPKVTGRAKPKAKSSEKPTFFKR